MDLKRDATETEEQYLWRIGQAVDSGDIASWASINDTVNTELGIDEDKWRDESSFRKRYQAAKKFYDNCFSKMETSQYQEQLDDMNRELMRNKIKFRDERNSWNKQNYEDARIEEAFELFGDRLDDIANVQFPVHDISLYDGADYCPELLVCLSDLHIGTEFHNSWGNYDSVIAKERLEDYLEQVIAIGELHNAHVAHVACIGDMISGLIHQTVQLTNKENVIDQTKIAIEYIASFCYELTKHFSEVRFYNIGGNHSRLQKNKDDSLIDERMDDLIGWTVCKLLEHIENFVDCTGTRRDLSMSELQIRGKDYVLLHGDMDNFCMSSVGDLVTMLGYCPDYLICGHKHTPRMEEFNGVTMYQVGCLPGSGDDYTVKNRLSGAPSQTVFVCDNTGVRCCYNIKL